jgi:membrane-associated phospholipid phosphatase
MVCLTATKTLIPAFEPMWADPLLADFDRWLLGAEAWALAEFLRPLDTVIDVLYALWSLVLQIVVIAVLLASPSRAKARVAISFFLTMALVGVVGQFVLPSGGPIFWSRLGLGHRFDAMQSAPHSIVAASYLWGKHMGNTVDFATGISAFPSMHVAMAAWMVVATHSLFPRFKFLSWFYFLVILLGSVFLGWHYLVDGIGGAFGMICCWWLAPLFIRVPNAHRNAIANFGESLE